MYLFDLLSLYTWFHLCQPHSYRETELIIMSTQLLETKGLNQNNRVTEPLFLFRIDSYFVHLFLFQATDYMSRDYLYKSHIQSPNLLKLTGAWFRDLHIGKQVCYRYSTHVTAFLFSWLWQSIVHPGVLKIWVDTEVKLRTLLFDIRTRDLQISKQVCYWLTVGIISLYI